MDIIKKIMFSKILSELEKEKNKPGSPEKFLNVFNSGVMIEVDKIKRVSLNLAIKIVKMVENQYKNTKR